jgi:hypothetical protein
MCGEMGVCHPPMIPRLHQADQDTPIARIIIILIIYCTAIMNPLIISLAIFAIATPLRSDLELIVL